MLYDIEIMWKKDKNAFSMFYTLIINQSECTDGVICYRDIYIVNGRFYARNNLVSDVKAVSRRL